MPASPGGHAIGLEIFSVERGARSAVLDGHLDGGRSVVCRDAEGSESAPGRGVTADR